MSQQFLKSLVAMISLTDVYHVIAATVPLYVAMILAYMSVKWWKLFTPDQCAGINKYVAKFSIPLVSFQVISTNNPYKMNMKLIYSDFFQKLLAFVVLAAITKFSSRGGLRWIITGLSLSTLPNSLILGIPVLKAMYGDQAALLLAQIVVSQSLIWYNILLFLFELNAAKTASVVPNPELAEDMDAAQESQSKDGGEETHNKTERRVKTMRILLTVARKLIANPNTHATLLGLMLSSIHFRWGVHLPAIIDKSILILSSGGLGMAMFSLGLFMASRPSIIACGTRMAAIAMTMKFIIGPGLMAASTLAIGLRGTVFKIAFAALPQGIVPFVFAKEYNVDPDVLSTGVVFGLLITLPIALAYYFLLAL